jgi:hypothetical protein
MIALSDSLKNKGSEDHHKGDLTNECALSLNPRLFEVTSLKHSPI